MDGQHYATGGATNRWMSSLMRPMAQQTDECPALCDRWRDKRIDIQLAAIGGLLRKYANNDKQAGAIT